MCEEMDWTTWNPEALWNEAWKVHIHLGPIECGTYI